MCTAPGATSIEAVTSECTYRVNLSLKYPNGGTSSKRESKAPYFLFGDRGGQVYGEIIYPGIYEISAYPDDDPTKTVKYSFSFKDC